VPPARLPPGGPRGVGTRGVDRPLGVDRRGVVRPRGVVVHPRGVDPRGVVRVVHPRGVGPRGVGRLRDVGPRGVVHPHGVDPRPAVAVCWTGAGGLRSLWLAMGSVPGGSPGYRVGSLEVWVTVLIVDVGLGAVDGSWPVLPQPLMFLPAIRPSRSPAVLPGAERWQSSLPVIRFPLFLFRFGTAAAARLRLSRPGSLADVL